nr:hsp70 [Haliclona caerulea]
MADGGDGERPRVPRSLQELLKMSAEEAGGMGEPSVFEEMDPERREWLKEAIASFSEDTFVKRMMSCLDTLAKQTDDEDEEAIASKESALEELESMVDIIDNANDLHKIGGFPVVAKYLKDTQSELRWRAADVLAVVAQNNPYSQTALTDMGVMPTLLQLLDNDPADQVRIKALYALSSLTRDFQPGEKAFLENDGFSVLMRAMQGNIEKVKIKAAFLLRNMVCYSEDPSHKDTLVNMGMVDQFVGLLHGPQESFHEHVLSAFVVLVTDNPRAVEECRRPELRLDELLDNKIQELKKQDKEAHMEEIEYCKELKKMCFPDNRNTQDDAASSR